MDTNEHTEVGNALQFSHWEVLKNNPYVTFDEQGVMHLNLQGITENGFPQQIGLNVASGVVIAMSGDYFGGREVELDLPSLTDYNQLRKSSLSAKISRNLGEYLIKEPITSEEEQKLIRSYKRLANPNVQNADIDTIYTINNANYIPFSSTLNTYVQQLMFALRVNNYGEMLNRNLSHFTPWSIRVYILGHNLALKYARVSFELNQLIANPQYKSENEEFNSLLDDFKKNKNEKSPKNLQDLAYRYQAMALGMELFCFHYYSDHFAAGHGALVGDLRSLLPERFGLLGGILVNNLHDELNRVSVYTKRPYDPTPDSTEPPVETRGDGDFDTLGNYYNKQSCIAGMQESMEDIHRVFQGHKMPQQKEYGGLSKMPDIDTNYRQPQPLFLLGEDNIIYYRTKLNKIRTFSPSDMKAAHESPKQYGYTELTSTFKALLLVGKLRALSYFYQGEMEPLTEAELARIEDEERQLNPGRLPIPQYPGIQKGQVPVFVPQWQKPASSETVMKGLNRNGVLAASTKTQTSVLEPELESANLSI